MTSAIPDNIFLLLILTVTPSKPSAVKQCRTIAPVQLLATKFRSHHICITLKNSLKRPFADDLLSNRLNLVPLEWKFDIVLMLYHIASKGNG
jgi:hypothetical protein